MDHVGVTGQELTSGTAAGAHKIIAIVWAPEEARTAMYAKRLQAPLYNVHYLQYKRPLVAPIKYIAQWLRTWQILFQQRPRFVYITNPPVFAVLCVFLYCRVMGARYIMDTHPPALYSRKWRWTVPLQRLMIRFAYVNIIDQERYATLFESWGGRAVILERPPRDIQFSTLEHIAKPGAFSVSVVNTFAADEPLDPILDAARQLPQVHFYIMGDTAMAKPGVIQNAPPNVTFTGYLRGKDYWNRLYSSQAVMVLTTYPYSLLGGAQDGVLLHKPLILSRQPVLTDFFRKGAVFVENTAAGIVKGVQEAQAQESQLIQESCELQEEQSQRWETNFQRLLELIQ